MLVGWRNLRASWTPAKPLRLPQDLPSSLTPAETLDAGDPFIAELLRVRRKMLTTKSSVIPLMLPSTEVAHDQ